VAEPARWKTKELHLEGVQQSHRPVRDCQARIDNGQQKASSICIMRTLYAEASTTEEPDAGKPHVRVCAGGAG
jgi:hypothetical protein